MYFRTERRPVLGSIRGSKDQAPLQHDTKAGAAIVADLQHCFELSVSWSVGQVVCCEGIIYPLASSPIRITALSL